MRTGDIVKLLASDERKLILATRDEIIPHGAHLRLRITYRLAGEEYAERWFTQQEISPCIPRRAPLTAF